MPLPEGTDTTLEEELISILVDRSAGTEDTFSEDSIEELYRKLGKIVHAGEEPPSHFDSVDAESGDSDEIDPYHDTQY